MCFIVWGEDGSQMDGDGARTVVKYMGTGCKLNKKFLGIGDHVANFHYRVTV